MSDISSKRDPTYGCENKVCLYVSQRAMQGFLVVFILLLAEKKNAVFKFIFYSYLDQLMGFPHSSVGKSSACRAGDLGSIPGLGRSLGEGNGNPFQYSCLENPMDRGA